MLVLILLLCVVKNPRILHGQTVIDTKLSYNSDTLGKDATLSNVSVCTMQVESFTGIYLEHWIGELKTHFVHYKLIFNNTRVINVLPTVIRPLKWVWTYHPPKSVIPYLNWPVDFRILSFGLLCAKCLDKEVSIYINVMPSNCTVVLGHQNTSLSIATALNEMTQTYLVKFHASYNYSYWCYLSEIPGVRDTLSYKFALYFSYPVDFLRYKCCASFFNYSKDTVEVSCPEEMKEKWRGSSLGPYIIGLVLLCYCPLILCRWGDIMTANGRTIPAENQYEDLDESDKGQWIYLDGHAPISLTGLLCSLCDLGWKYPVEISRLRRTLFVLLSPIIIFLQFLLYSTYQGDMTLDLIDHGVPIGFLSMLGGVEKSKRLFVPMLGGPYYLLFMYYVTAFIFLVVPRNLGDLIQTGAVDSKYAGLSPLVLCSDRIEEISMVPVNQYNGYKRLSMLLLARFYLIMMPRFWVDAVFIVCRRVKHHINILIMYLPMPLVITLSCFMIPLYLIFGLIEICLSLIYYNIPIIWFLLVVINGFMSRATACIETQSTLSMSPFARLIFRISLSTIIGPLLLYFVYGFFAIYLASFSIIGEIIVFLFYALVLFPTSSFGYLFFGGALLYYIFKLLRGIGDVYYELLSDLVQLCTNYDLEHTIPKLQNSTAHPGIPLTPFLVNNITLNLTEQQRNTMQTPANAIVRKYVHYDKHIPGISRRLFNFVVRKCKPVHITVFQAFFKIGLIVMFVIGATRLSMKSNGMSSQYSEMMHALFIVVIGAFPRMLEITLSQTDKAVQKEIHRNMLVMLIQEYNQYRMESSDQFST